jgi:hypothetical protein
MTVISSYADLLKVSLLLLLPLPLLLPGLRTGMAALPCLGSQASSSLRLTPTCPHGSSGWTASAAAAWAQIEDSKHHQTVAMSVAAWMQWQLGTTAIAVL